MFSLFRISVNKENPMNNIRVYKAKKEKRYSIKINAIKATIKPIAKAIIEPNIDVFRGILITFNIIN